MAKTTTDGQDEGGAFAFIVLTGPFRVFKSKAQAEKAAKESTEASGTHHAVIGASILAPGPVAHPGDED